MEEKGQLFRPGKENGQKPSKAIISAFACRIALPEREINFTARESHGQKNIFANVSSCCRGATDDQPKPALRPHLLETSGDECTRVDTAPAQSTAVPFSNRPPRIGVTAHQITRLRTQVLIQAPNSRNDCPDWS